MTQRLTFKVKVIGQKSGSPGQKLLCPSSFDRFMVNPVANWHMAQGHRSRARVKDSRSKATQVKVSLKVMILTGGSHQRQVASLARKRLVCVFLKKKITPRDKMVSHPCELLHG